MSVRATTFAASQGLSPLIHFERSEEAPVQGALLEPKILRCAQDDIYTERFPLRSHYKTQTSQPVRAKETVRP